MSLALTANERERVRAAAAKSEIPPERWLVLAVLHALAVDEGHWRELEERDAIRAQVDRAQFGRLSHHMRGLPASVLERLAEVLALAQQRGRQEGAASALRLVALRTRRGRS
jgi:hypothetical protein